MWVVFIPLYLDSRRRNYRRIQFQKQKKNKTKICFETFSAIGTHCFLLLLLLSLPCFYVGICRDAAMPFKTMAFAMNWSDRRRGHCFFSVMESERFPQVLQTRCARYDEKPSGLKPAQSFIVNRSRERARTIFFIFFIFNFFLLFSYRKHTLDVYHIKWQRNNDSVVCFLCAAHFGYSA